MRHKQKIFWMGSRAFRLVANILDSCLCGYSFEFHNLMGFLRAPQFSLSILPFHSLQHLDNFYTCLPCVTVLISLLIIIFALVMNLFQGLLSNHKKSKRFCQKLLGVVMLSKFVKTCDDLMVDRTHPLTQIRSSQLQCYKR